MKFYRSVNINNPSMFSVLCNNKDVFTVMMNRHYKIIEYCPQLNCMAYILGSFRIGV